MKCNENSREFSRLFISKNEVILQGPFGANYTDIDRLRQPKSGSLTF